MGVPGYISICKKSTSPVSLLASDSSNDYYKVAVPYGVKMIEGAVVDACDTANMNPVCFSKDISNKYNVKDCVTMATPKQIWSMRDVSTLTCNTTKAENCSELYGVFSSVPPYLTSDHFKD